MSNRNERICAVRRTARETKHSLELLAVAIERLRIEYRVQEEPHDPQSLTDAQAEIEAATVHLGRIVLQLGLMK